MHVGNLSLLAGAVQNPFVVSNGLVGYWSFNDGNGNIARDFSTSGNNGTLVASPPWVTGKVGGALSLNGSTQYVSLSSKNLSGLSATNWSVSCWIKQTSLITYSGIIVFNNEGLVNTKNNDLGLMHAGDVVACSTSVLSNNGKWIHVIGTNASSVFTIYINGINSNGSFLSDSGYGLANVYFIGQGYESSMMNGLIDDVRIYNRALNPPEITALYLAT